MIPEAFSFHFNVGAVTPNNSPQQAAAVATTTIYLTNTTVPLLPNTPPVGHSIST